MSWTDESGATDVSGDGTVRALGSFLVVTEESTGPVDGSAGSSP